jgi:hypothetical protein
MRDTQEDFARQMLMRLPRSLPNLNFAQHVTHDGSQERLAIEAAGPRGFRAILLADAHTCVPVALEYIAAGAAKRVDLSAYRLVDGIRFPTMLKTSRDEAPFLEESVSKIEVNAPNVNADFATGP